MNAQQTLAAKIANLAELTMPDLWQVWDTYFPRRPEKTMRSYIEGRIAYVMQSEVHGALPKLTQNKLFEIGSQQSRIKSRIATNDNQMMIGTTLLREFGGQEHCVTVTANGFEYAGKSFKSLSSIARHITGTPWSGPVFFGLKKSGSRKRMHLSQNCR